MLFETHWKERTLFNYNVKDGWPKLRDFLGLETTSDQFPHENKGKNADDFVMSLFAESKYRQIFEHLSY